MRWLDELIDRQVERRMRAAQQAEPSRIRVRGLSAAGDDSELAPEKYLEYARTSNAVYACSTLRANMLSALPLRVYKLGTGAVSGRARYGRTIDVSSPTARLGMPLTAHGRAIAAAGEVTEVEGGALVDLLTRVNPLWTRRRLIYMTELSLCLAGQGFWTLDRGANGKRPPTSAYYAKHTRMLAHRHPETIIDGWTRDPNTTAAEELSTGEVVWFRFPDPLDPDYGALPPLAAARLGADVYRAAMRSNWALFANGYAPGGFVFPPEGQQWDDEQLAEASEAVRQRLEGVDRRHRWLFMPEHYTVEPNTMTPKDAEFLGGLDFAVEDVARAYGLPIELVGGARRTYQNLENALRGVWMFTLEPEASFLADELTEQLVPMFGGEADFVGFDLSGVTALQDDETAEWARQREQLDAGVLTAEEWRAGQGLEPLEQGAKLGVGKVEALVTLLQYVGLGQISADSAKAVVSIGLDMGDEAAEAIVGGAIAAPPPPADSDETVAGLALPGNGRAAGAGVEGRGAPAYIYGGPEHEARWQRVVDDTEPIERDTAALMADLFRRQQASIISQMEQRAAPTGAEMAEWFGVSRWTKTFRVEIRPLLRRAVDAAAGAVWDDLAAPGAFDAGAPAVSRFLTARAQRFATEVNDTTWRELKASLDAGITGGEGMPDLIARVQSVMGARILSSAETVARTETLGAYNGGALQAAQQSGVSNRKRWHSALDERTRSTHVAAHGQTVRIDDDFRVGGAEGPCPGSMGSPAEDINCRCAVQYLVDYDDEP